jgi:hypothetical protein
MISDDKIIEIFCKIDDFMKEYDQIIEEYSLSTPNNVRKQKRESKISDSEIMTILILFHLKSYRNLKHFYLVHISKYRRDLFPEVVSYNRFVELEKKVIQPLGIFLKLFGLGECTGISFINSTTLKVCYYKSEKQHKVLKVLLAKVQEQWAGFMVLNYI